MTVDEALGYADSDQYSDDPVVAVLVEEVERLRTENVLATNQEVLTANWAGELKAEVERMQETIDLFKAENAELRSAIADYFSAPSGEKKRAIRLRFGLPVLCDHQGIGRVGCPTCDPRRPKPGDGT